MEFQSSASLSRPQDLDQDREQRARYTQSVREEEAESAVPLAGEQGQGEPCALAEDTVLRKLSMRRRIICS